MKNRKFFSAIITFMVSLLEPLYLKAEKSFTLGIIESLPTDNSRYAGTTSSSNGNTSVTVNIQNPGVIDQSDEVIIDPMSQRTVIPNTLTQTIVSNLGSGDENITAYFLNEDTYNTTTTNNGSGTDSVSNVYSDGWVGLGYNQLARSANGGRGIICYGFTLVYKVTSGGAQDPTGLAAASPSYVAYNNVGANGQMAVGEPLNEGIRAGNYQTGTMTLLRKFYLCSVNQINYVVPPGDTVSMIVLSKPQRA
jgi:hypothetical protein